jgi:hypothetical protein
MGENSVTVDPGDLRGLAGRIAACADRVGALRCPVLGAGAFDGAAVSRLVGPDAVTARLADLSADLRGWAEAVGRTGRSFADTDVRTADAIGRA